MPKCINIIHICRSASSSSAGQRKPHGDVCVCVSVLRGRCRRHSAQHKYLWRQHRRYRAQAAGRRKVLRVGARATAGPAVQERACGAGWWSRGGCRVQCKSVHSGVVVCRPVCMVGCVCRGRNSRHTRAGPPLRLPHARVRACIARRVGMLSRWMGGCGRYPRRVACAMHMCKPPGPTAHAAPRTTAIPHIDARFAAAPRRALHVARAQAPPVLLLMGQGSEPMPKEGPWSLAHLNKWDAVYVIRMRG
jgi:hypothetical protein